MAISSQGATFSFSGFSAHYTSISVQEPEFEVVDMTKIDDPIGTRRMVSTGDVTSPARMLRSIQDTSSSRMMPTGR